MRLAIAAALMLFVLVPTAQAAEHTIRIVETDGQEVWQFEPRDLTIAAGDTVVWIDEAPAGHTATSEDAGFDHAFRDAATFRFTFDDAGTFDYRCKPHAWMTGTITVLDAGGQGSTSSTSSDPAGFGNGEKNESSAPHASLIVPFVAAAAILFVRRR